MDESLVSFHWSFKKLNCYYLIQVIENHQFFNFDKSHSLKIRCHLKKITFQNHKKTGIQSAKFYEYGQDRCGNLHLQNSVGKKE